MIRYGQHVANTPQSEPLVGQVENSAGGFAFPVDQWKALERFLVLGSEGGSYYAGEAKLTRDNAKSVIACIKADGARAVNIIAAISVDGRAPKNDPAIFALALAVKEGDVGTRRLALQALQVVARIGTHVFQFVQLLKDLGVGWGRMVKRGIAAWYLMQPPSKLANNAIKYQQRDGWAHRDLLRLAHPRAGDVSIEEAQRASVLHWIVKGWPDIGKEPHPDVVLARIWAFERAKQLGDGDVTELCKLIEVYGLPRECVPSQMLTVPVVWSALLSQMGATALLRNLGKMTAVGLLTPMSADVGFVRTQLTDVEYLRRGRMHPLAILVALKTYAQGHGEKGKLSWSPNQKIVDALDEAFYLAFQAVEPTGKRTLLALDVSGSMDDGQIAGMTGISPRVGSAAMALVTAAAEPNVDAVAFTNGPGRSRFAQAGCGLTPFPLSARRRLDDVVKQMKEIPFGGTDCALPMLYAMEHKIAVDTFAIYTDSETWAGDMHPVEALRRYRQKTGIAAKLVVVGMVSNGFSIADPNDAGMLDVVGFDTAAPAVIADFSR